MLRLSKGRVSSATWVLLNLSKVAFLQDGPGGQGQELQCLVSEHGRCWGHAPKGLTARGSLVGKPGPGTPLPVAPTPALVRWQAARFAQDLRSAGNPHFLPSQAFPWQDPQEGPACHAENASPSWNWFPRNAIALSCWATPSALCWWKKALVVPKRLLSAVTGRHSNGLLKKEVSPP